MPVKKDLMVRHLGKVIGDVDAIKRQQFLCCNQNLRVTKHPLRHARFNQNPVLQGHDRVLCQKVQARCLFAYPNGAQVFVFRQFGCFQKPRANPAQRLIPVIRRQNQVPWPQILDGCSSCRRSLKRGLGGFLAGKDRNSK